MGTPLDPKRNHRIDLGTASGLTRRYRDTAQPAKANSGAFNADQVQELLKQPGCVGLRYYQAIGDDGAPCMVLVGVDGNGNDMTGGVLLELQMPCPPWCPDGNSLNS